MKARSVFIVSVLVISTLTNTQEREDCSLLLPERANDCKESHDEQIMVANFFNIIMNGIVAASNNDNKEKQTQAVTAALVSVSNLVQLAFKANENLDCEELSRIMHNRLTQPEMIQAINKMLKKKGKLLKRAMNKKCS